MKNARNIFRRVVAGLFISTLSLITTLPSNLYAAKMLAGTVDYAVKEVNIKSDKGKERKAKPGGKIFLGDTVFTGEKSKIKVSFEDGNILMLGPQSKIKIDEFSFSKDTNESVTTLDKFSGKVRAVVRKLLTPKSQFKIKTSNSVIGVLGTDFVLTYDEKNKILKAFSRSGKIRIASPKNLWPAVVITENNFSEVKGRSKPTQPKSFISPEGYSVVDEPLLNETQTVKDLGDVTQGEWARMLVGALPYDNSPDFRDYPDEQIKNLLGGIPENAVSVDTFKKNLNNPQLIPHGTEGEMAISVMEPSATLFYYLVFPVSGDVDIFANIKGGAQYWTLAEQPTVVSRYQVVASNVNIGKIRLPLAGIKRLGISIPNGGQLISLNFKAFGKSPITPFGGWKMDKKLTNMDMALTIIQALDWQHKLPFEKGFIPLGITSKKESKPLGGLEGYDHFYNDFFIKNEGFYSFQVTAVLGDLPVFLVNDYLKKRAEILSDDKSKNGSATAEIYMKEGKQFLKLHDGSDKDPGSIIARKREMTFAQILKIFEGTDFMFGDENSFVDYDIAQANIDALIGLNKGIGDIDDQLLPKKIITKGKIIKRRSVSPILPLDEGR